MLDNDDTQTQQIFAKQLNVTIEAIFQSLKAMVKIQKSDKFVPYELNERQKDGPAYHLFALMGYAFLDQYLKTFEEVNKCVEEWFLQYYAFDIANMHLKHLIRKICIMVKAFKY